MTLEERSNLYQADSLERFRKMQSCYYDTALTEIRSGRKQTHWIWYIFPQIDGLGRSATAQYFEIQGREEAQRYWQDPYLRAHLVEITEALLAVHKHIREVMDFPDNLKLRSCMTLFWLVTGDPVFKTILDRFFEGEMDEYTVHKLGGM